MTTTTASLLTARQLEVLRLAAQGHSNAAIGRRLNLSLDTVKSHCQNTMALLGGRDRPHAVAIGIALGLVPTEDVLSTRLEPRPTRYEKHLAYLADGR